MSQVEVNHNPFLKCPWCECHFLCEDDLNAHLEAFKNKPAPINGERLNERDHQENWNREMWFRDHREHISNG